MEFYYNFIRNNKGKVYFNRTNCTAFLRKNNMHDASVYTIFPIFTFTRPDRFRQYALKRSLAFHPTYYTTRYWRRYDVTTIDTFLNLRSCTLRDKFQGLASI